MEHLRYDLPARVEMRGDTIVADDTPVAHLAADAPAHVRHRFANMIDLLAHDDVTLCDAGDVKGEWE